ncbi:hypothetical protein [Accumulibacter sp.]|jgi:hypothetical protein|uniref:hypothetical protein n=1 Tax=Accumulibacter sp. TaxID=2053492 RepID=UPI001AC8F191|nr:hypothetical protein [Accumulibacter sp.]MBN8453381.1 hypothetical protein [Accumulibacter sp.]MBO3705018.1 hypothetical protein [Candidatus Accumulibacter conexus]
MRWLIALLLSALAQTAAADETLRVCYNYGCLHEAEVRYTDRQFAQVEAFLAAAGDAADERDRLSLVIGWLLAWAGEQTAIAADRGGNVADDGIDGRMDCIDHSTTTTRLLRMLENRRWLRFHQVLEPVQRTRYLFAVHFSAQIGETAAATTPDGEAGTSRHYVVDSWFRDNGRPAVVMPLPEWLAGGGEEESSLAAMASLAAGAPAAGP